MLFHAFPFFVVVGVVILARFCLAIVHHSANHVCIGLAQLLIGIHDFIAASEVLANDERSSVNERSNGRRVIHHEIVIARKPVNQTRKTLRRQNVDRVRNMGFAVQEIKTLRRRHNGRTQRHLLRKHRIQATACMNAQHVCQAMAAHVNLNKQYTLAALGNSRGKLYRNCRFSLIRHRRR